MFTWKDLPNDIDVVVQIPYETRSFSGCSTRQYYPLNWDNQKTIRATKTIHLHLLIEYKPFSTKDFQTYNGLNMVRFRVFHEVVHGYVRNMAVVTRQTSVSNIAVAPYNLPPTILNMHMSNMIVSAETSLLVNINDANLIGSCSLSKIQTKIVNHINKFTCITTLKPLVNIYISIGRCDKTSEMLQNGWGWT